MTIDTPVRVFLVDDHRIIRLGLRQLLDHIGIFAVAGEAGSGEEALEKIYDTRPDLALVDIAMGGMNGIELTRRLKQNRPDMRVLMLSSYEDTHYIRQARKAGADGYLIKNSVDKQMEEAVEAVLSGRSYFSSGGHATT